MKRPLRFWIYPNLSTKQYKFEVIIYPTRKGMVRNFRTNEHNKNWEIVQAFFRPYVKVTVFSGKKDKGRVTGQIGELGFYVDGMSIGTVAHECFHAAVQFGRKKRIKSRDFKDMSLDTEEVIAYATGSMVDQVVNKLIEKRIRVPQE